MRDWFIPRAEAEKRERNPLRERLLLASIVIGSTAVFALGASVLTQIEHPASEAQDFLEDIGYIHVEYTDTNRIFTGCTRGNSISYDFNAQLPHHDEIDTVRVCASVINGLSLPLP